MSSSPIKKVKSPNMTSSNTSPTHSKSTTNKAPTNPSIVGNSFIKQYYHLLAQSPERLHRFYKDESSITRGIGSHLEESVKGQKKINEKIISQNYAGAQVDLESGSVDCQESQQGGVLVMVTGTMTLKEQKPRFFTQAFFLAVQTNGYFVLNDTFRFVDGMILDTNINENQVVLTDKSKLKNTTSVVEKSLSSINTTQKSVTESMYINSSKKAPSNQNSPLHTAKTSNVPISSLNSPKPNSKMSSKTDSPSSIPMKSPVVSSLTTITIKHEEKILSPAKLNTQNIAEKALNKKNENDAVVNSPKKNGSPSPKAPETPTLTPSVAARPASWASLFSGKSETPATPPSNVSSNGASQQSSSSNPKQVSPSARKPMSGNTPNNNNNRSNAGKKDNNWNISKEENTKVTGNTYTNSNKERSQMVPNRAASLYVSNLPTGVTEELLFELFKPYGNVVNVNLVANSQRNYAFIDYAAVEDMKSALANKKQYYLLEKLIHVEERNAEKKSRYGGNSQRGGQGRKMYDSNKDSNKAHNKVGSRRATGSNSGNSHSLKGNNNNNNNNMNHSSNSSMSKNE